MSTASTDDAPDRLVDGRVARRERNRDAVLDVVLDLFAEESLVPTIEQVSQRSGLSLRSLYRYFGDPGALLEATIERHRATISDDTRLPQIGRGPVARRIDDLVEMRVGLYERVAPVYRATVHNAAAHPRIREQLATARRDLRDQFELQFAPELGRLRGRRRAELSAAGDVLTQLDTIDLLRRSRELTVAETVASLRSGLTALLAG